MDELQEIMGKPVDLVGIKKTKIQKENDRKRKNALRNFKKKIARIKN